MGREGLCSDSSCPETSISSRSPSPSSTSVGSEDFSSTEDEEDKTEEKHLVAPTPDPLAALEILTEMRVEDREEELVELFSCSEELVKDLGEEVVVISLAREDVRTEDKSSVTEMLLQSSRCSEEGRRSALRDTLERMSEEEEEEEESRVGVILRKLSLRRSGSRRNSIKKPPDKRLSDWLLPWETWPNLPGGLLQLGVP